MGCQKVKPRKQPGETVVGRVIRSLNGPGAMYPKKDKRVSGVMSNEKYYSLYWGNS